MVTMVRAFSCFVFGCAIYAVVGCQNSSPSENAKLDHSSAAGTVELEIEFNSDRKSIKVDVPCSADSTVFTILQRAQKMGDLKFDATGLADDMKFVTSIGGVDNLAAAGDNWVYRVNEKLGDKSSGIYPVEPGDHVHWAFGKYKENED
jgi:hypothetical protein